MRSLFRHQARCVQPLHDRTKSWFRAAACCTHRLTPRDSRPGGLRNTNRPRMQPLAHSRPDMLGHSLPRRATINEDAALRLFDRKCVVSQAQLLVKLWRFSLEPVCRILSPTALRTRQTDFSGDIQDECQLRIGRSNSDSLETADQALIDVAEGALINTRGIDEAVTNHPVARIQRRQDGRTHMVVTRRGEQDCLRFRPKRLCNTGKQNVPNDLGAGRTSRLSCEHNFYAGRFETLRKRPCVSRFAAAFAPFERNEMSAQSEPAFFDQRSRAVSPLIIAARLPHGKAR